MGIKDKFEEKHPGMFLLCRIVKRIGKKDSKYIDKILDFQNNPDYLIMKHNGEHDYGKIIYVIRDIQGIVGFGATVRFLIGYIIFAEQHGFIPKILFSDEFLYFDREMSQTISNPFEYYFVPNSDGYDASNAMNVCYADLSHAYDHASYPMLDAYDVNNYFDEHVFEICNPIINKYLQLKPDIVNESAAFLQEVKSSGKKILGVHYRGTDFKIGYDEHPVIVEPRQMIDKIKEAIASEKYDAVFLATDDQSMCENMERMLEHTTMLVYRDVIRSNGTESVAFSNSNRKYHHYLLGYEIARDIYTLSLCDGLVAGKSSVSFISNLYKHARNEKYEYLHIIDNGINHSGNEFKGKKSNHISS